MGKSRALSKRMQCVADAVIPCGVLADIGCDHGYVSIYLLQQGIADRVIAMDVREGPLSKALEHSIRAGLQERMECRISNGLDALYPNEADEIVIAGMGGPLMMDILARGLDKKKLPPYAVLQPQSEIPAVRRYVHSIGYKITQEAFLKEDGKYYTVLQIVRNIEAADRWTDVEYQYGKHILEESEEVLNEYLNKEAAKLAQIEQALLKQEAKAVTKSKVEKAEAGIETDRKGEAESERIRYRLEALAHEITLNEQALAYRKTDDHSIDS